MSWYSKRGIPRRRGYLFHGPPGTGKSSLAAAIAGYFQVGLYSLSLTDDSIDDKTLSCLLSKLREGSVLLLEDIDSAGLQRESSGRSYSYRTKVTLSGLLNALDGASASEGHIVIMSSNVPEALDEALVRAGRVDCRVEFKHASKASIANCFIRMMADDDDKDKNTNLEVKAQEFAELVPDQSFSLAEIQGYLVDHARDINGAIKDVSDWIKEKAAEDIEAKETAEKEKKDAEEQTEDMENELEEIKKKDEEAEKQRQKTEEEDAALVKIERETRKVTLQAKKLRAEAFLAGFHKKKGIAFIDRNAPMTPAESDDEQHFSATKTGNEAAKPAGTKNGDDKSICNDNE